MHGAHHCMLARNRVNNEHAMIPNIRRTNECYINFSFRDISGCFNFLDNLESRLTLITNFHLLNSEVQDFISHLVITGNTTCNNGKKDKPQMNFDVQYL